MSKDDKQQQPAVPLTLEAMQQMIQDGITKGVAEALEKSQPAAPSPFAPTTHAVPREEVEAFLASEPLDDEFFVLNPYQMLVVRDQKKVFDRDTGMERELSGIYLTFERFFGPGSDFRDDKGELLFKRGIGRRRLSEWPDLINHSDVDTKQIAARIHYANAENDAEDRILTSVEFRAMIRAEWAKRESARAADEAYLKEIAKAQNGEVEGNPRYAGNNL